MADALDNQAVIAGTSKSFAFAANAFSDADGDALTYSTGDLPSWLRFDALTRSFTAAPSASDVGTVSVHVIASDGRGGTVANEFDIVVSSPASGAAQIDLSGTAVRENSAAGTVIGALSVSDATGPFEFTLARNPKGVFDVVDGNLVVAGGADLDFETRDQYRVWVVATDESGARISESFTISVTDVVELIRGTPKSDVLLGGRGADIIKGMGSGDVIRGRGGDDHLKGGAGADRFVFGRGNDTVRDFDAGDGDVVDLRLADGIRNFQDLKANHMEETDRGLVITDDSGSTMTLRHVGLADIGAESFQF